VEPPKVGEQILVSQVFQPDGKVDVFGTSKGKGFAGVVNGTISAAARRLMVRCFIELLDQSRISISKPRLARMRAAGHMGDEKVTVQNLSVVGILEQENILLIKGAVPGRNGGYVVIKKA